MASCRFVPQLARLGDAKLRNDGEADKAVGRFGMLLAALNDAVRDAEAMRSTGLLVVARSNGTSGHERHSPGQRLVCA